MNDVSYQPNQVPAPLLVQFVHFLHSREQLPENQESHYKVWSDILIANILMDRKSDPHAWEISVSEYRAFTNTDINRMVKHLCHLIVLLLMSRFLSVRIA